MDPKLSKLTRATLRVHWWPPKRRPKPRFVLHLDATERDTQYPHENTVILYFTNPEELRTLIYGLSKAYTP